MKVALLTHTPLPEHTVASAARLCYSPASIDELREKLTEDNGVERSSRRSETLGAPV